MFEGPVTVLFAEDRVDLHGFPGGLVRLVVGDTASIEHNHYVVKIQVITKEQVKEET